MIAIALTLASALAAPMAPPEPLGVRVAPRAVVEVWTRDPALSEVYANGGPMMALGVVMPVRGGLALSFEGAYGRFRAGHAEGGALLQVTPVSLLVEYAAGTDRTQGFVDIGPSFVSFAEQGGAVGTRVMGTLRAGMRIDTGLVVPAMAPAPSPVRGLDLEIAGGRRVRAPARLNPYGDDPAALTGFNFNAWQLTIGLGVRL